MDFVEACRRFISIDTSPAAGTGELGQYIAELCKERHLHCELIEDFWQNNPQSSVIIRTGDTRPPLEFLLQTHLDTADPGPYALWAQTSQNPFDAHIRDGYIYGLGAADVKLDFLCKLEALSTFRSVEKWTLPPVLVGTYGEELGMPGSLKLIRKNKISAKMALIGEPSDFSVIVAGKGLAYVEAKIPFEEDEFSYKQQHDLKESTSTQSKLFHGRAAHSSEPMLGDSAIRKLLDSLMQLPDDLVLMEIDGGVNLNTVPSHAFLEIDPVSGFRFPMAKKIKTLYKKILDLETDFKKYKNTKFQPDTPTLNIGVVRTYDDHVHIAGSCRIPPNVGFDTYQTWMKDLTQACSELGGQFRVTDYKRPYVTDENSMLVRGCLAELEAMGLPSKIATQSNVNEASLWSRIGVECASFGPGKREENIHTPNENIKIEDLKKAIEFYRRIIERFCL